MLDHLSTCKPKRIHVIAKQQHNHLTDSKCLHLLEDLKSKPGEDLRFSQPFTHHPPHACHVIVNQSPQSSQRKKQQLQLTMKWKWAHRLLAPCLSLAVSIKGASGLAVDRSASTIRHDTFQKLVNAAFRSQRPLLMRGRSVDLGSTEIKLDADSEKVVIIGPGSIRGIGHTLFTTSGNRHSLTLENLLLEHCSSADRGDEKRHQGAAIWARGKSSIQLDNCTVTSESGFALWLVQRATAHLEKCTLGPCGKRSAIVVFNQARLDFYQGRIKDAGVHGVCSRGDTVVTIRDSLVSECGARGCYAYHNATLDLSDTTVSGTLQVDASAVQVEALRSCDKVRVRIRRCKLQGTGNRGFGLSVAGNVDCDLDDSVQVDCSLSAEQQLSKNRQSQLNY
jgi:hypothetical protein